MERRQREPHRDVNRGIAEEQGSRGEFEEPAPQTPAVEVVGELELLRDLRAAVQANGGLGMIDLVSRIVEGATSWDRIAHLAADSEPASGLSELIGWFIAVDVAETSAALHVLAVLVEDEGARERIRQEYTMRQQPVPEVITSLADARVTDVYRLSSDSPDVDLLMLRLDGWVMPSWLVQLERDAPADTGTSTPDPSTPDPSQGAVPDFSPSDLADEPAAGPSCPGSAASGEGESSSYSDRAVETVTDSYYSDRTLAEVFELSVEMYGSQTTAEEWRPAGARARIERAIEASERLLEPVFTESWPGTRPLLRALLRTLPTEEPRYLLAGEEAVRVAVDEEPGAFPRSNSQDGVTAPEEPVLLPPPEEPGILPVPEVPDDGSRAAESGWPVVDAGPHGQLTDAKQDTSPSSEAQGSFALGEAPVVSAETSSSRSPGDEEQRFVTVEMRRAQVAAAADVVTSAEYRSVRMSADPRSVDAEIVDTLMWLNGLMGAKAPLEWNVPRVERALLDLVPRKVHANLDYLERIPDVLRVTVQVAGRLTDKPKPLVSQMVAAVDRVREPYLRFVRERARDRGGDATLRALGLMDRPAADRDSEAAIASKRMAKLAAEMGGEDALARLDPTASEPLVERPLDLDGVPDPVRETAEQVEALAMDAISTLFGVDPEEAVFGARAVTPETPDWLLDALAVSGDSGAARGGLVEPNGPSVSSEPFALSETPDWSLDPLGEPDAPDASLEPLTSQKADEGHPGAGSIAEYRAAVRVLIERLARQSPESIRRGKDAVTAGALCWAVGLANNLLRDGGPADELYHIMAIGPEAARTLDPMTDVHVQELYLHLWLRTDVPKRAGVLMQRIGLSPQWVLGQYALGDPELLTSHKRRLVAAERDWWASALR